MKYIDIFNVMLRGRIMSPLEECGSLEQHANGYS